MLFRRVLISLVFPMLVLGWSQEAGSRQLFFEVCRRSFAVAGVAVFRPENVKAFERRDVGDPKSRSPATAAMNEQAYQTNNRLEASGFKLDTREEEQARLASAMASFSYDSATGSKNQNAFPTSVATKNKK
jgi:hypothetical protein